LKLGYYVVSYAAVGSTIATVAGGLLVVAAVVGVVYYCGKAYKKVKTVKRAKAKPKSKNKKKKEKSNSNMI